MEGKRETRIIQPGLYVHYKGGKYIVTGRGIHTETNEDLVFYYDESFKQFARPANTWFEDVGPDRDKPFSDTELRHYVPRFQLLRVIQTGRIKPSEVKV